MVDVELPVGRSLLDADTASTDEIRNLALAVRMTWGTTLGSPVGPQLQALVQGLDADAASVAVGAAVDAEQIGCRLVDRAQVSGSRFVPPPRQEMDAAVLGAHPWVDDENLGRLFNQACYYAWHG